MSEHDVNIATLPITWLSSGYSRQGNSSIIEFSNHQTGTTIFRSDYKEIFSSVDNVQLLSNINPHDGTVINVV